MKIAKKIFKWGGITFLLLIIAMIAIPFFFKDTIKEKVIEMANKNLKANIALQDVDISLFKNFPKAQVTLNDFIAGSPNAGSVVSMPETSSNTVPEFIAR